MTMNRIVTINAGGQRFQTHLSTLLRFPKTRFAQLFASAPPEAPPRAATNADTADLSKSPAEADYFLDVSPAVFAHVLSFLRTNTMHLPTHDEALRAELVHCLAQWDLLSPAFAGPDAEDAQPSGEGEADSGDQAPSRPTVVLPDVCVVQLCDHMQHDQGVKRHALTMTYGADGFQLRRLTQAIRRDLHLQLSSTYWQCYQTNERAAFFTTTKIANGAADLLTTAITQQVVAHTESMGYHLTSSYLTLSPDVVHTSVRMLIHNFIFRRTRLPVLEQSDEEAALLGELDADDGSDTMETFQNFEPRPVGPQKGLWEASSSRPAPEQASRKIW